MPDLYYDFVFGSTTASVLVGDSTATLDDVTSFPPNTALAKGDFYLTFDSALTHPTTFETVKVTNVNTTTKVITFTPAAATAHAIGTYAKGTLTAGMLKRLRAGLSGTIVPSQDDSIYAIGDPFLLTTTNTLYVYTSTGFVPVGGSGRQTATATTSSLAPNAVDSTTTIAMSKGYLLYSIATSVPARVRLYTTAAACSADLSRAAGNDPLSSAGVVLDYVTTTANTVYPLSPMVFGANEESSPSSSISMTVQNLSPATTATVTVTLVWLKEE